MRRDVACAGQVDGMAMDRGGHTDDAIHLVALIHIEAEMRREEAG